VRFAACVFCGPEHTRGPKEVSKSTNLRALLWATFSSDSVEHVVEMMSKPVQMILATVMIDLGHAVETTEPTITLSYELNGAPHSVTILARAPAFGPDLPSGTE
jgi:hypothetical protein